MPHATSKDGTSIAFERSGSGPTLISVSHQTMIAGVMT